MARLQLVDTQQATLASVLFVVSVWCVCLFEFIVCLSVLLGPCRTVAELLVIIALAAPAAATHELLIMFAAMMP
jgi:hypothetical protein